MGFTENIACYNYEWADDETNIPWRHQMAVCCILAKCRIAIPVATAARWIRLQQSLALGGVWEPRINEERWSASLLVGVGQRAKNLSS
jgi:hypothetical protein